MEIDFDKYKEIQYCDNEDCEFYGMIGDGNIRTHSRRTRQVYCNQCHNIWVITKNTFFYNLKKEPKDVLEVLALLSEGISMRGVCRVKGVTMDILKDWILKAAEHVNELSFHFKAEMDLTQCQIDEFWSFIRKKKQKYLKKKST